MICNDLLIEVTETTLVIMCFHIANELAALLDMFPLNLITYVPPICNTQVYLPKYVYNRLLANLKSRIIIVSKDSFT